MIAPELHTKRLILRRWRQEDIEPFAEINADPQVMEFFPKRLTLRETEEMVGRIEAGFEENGFGLWATEIAETAEFIGFVGLGVPRFEAHFTPCVEVGWRLAHRCWGKGYAPEAAREALKAGFETFALEEIISMTATVNLRSMRVMEKIGMERNPQDDFMHPSIADESDLKAHVLYRLKRDKWKQTIVP